MIRSRYAISSSATPNEAARAAVGEELRRYLPALQESPSEMTQLLARLVARESAERRAAERRTGASLQLPLPQWPQS